MGDKQDVCQVEEPKCDKPPTKVLAPDRTLG